MYLLHSLSCNTEGNNTDYYIKGYVPFKCGIYTGLNIHVAIMFRRERNP